ncbi:MAG: hypothetical protein RLO12_15645, partial [Fulvivirga sp.]
MTKKITAFLLFAFFLSCQDDDSTLNLTPPKNFNASKGESSDHIKISWSKEEVAKFYHLYRFDSIEGDFIFFNSITDTVFLDTANYTPEQKIYYKLKSYNSESEQSELSESQYGFLKTTKLPAPIINASKGDFLDKISISWEEIEGASKYEIFRLSKSTEEYLLLAVTEETKFEDFPNSEPGERNYYKLRAISSDNTASDFSSPDFGFFTELIPLDRPINFKATKGDFGKKIELNWTAVPGVSSYKVLRFSDEIDDYEELAIVTKNTYSDESDRVPYNEQYYKVQSYNSNYSFSEFSDIDYGYTSGRNYDLVLEFGAWGDGNGQFRYPYHINLDAEKNIYVSDANTNKIQKFTKDGDFIEVYLSSYAIRSMAFFDNGNVAVARSGNHIISIYDQDKNLVK